MVNSRLSIKPNVETNNIRFNAKVHMEEIEEYRQHLFTVMIGMEDGDVPMDVSRYDRIYDLFYGDLWDLYEVLAKRDGKDYVYITEEQMELAQKIISLMSKKRDNTSKGE